MATISCDVIRDLLPLYVDGVLSPDSQKLVEEHLSDCSYCRDYHEKLLHTNTNLRQGSGGDGDAIKKLRKKIKAKRLRAVCLTAALAVLIAGALWYTVIWHERYVPYDNDAFYVYNDALCVKQYYRQHCYGFTDDGTQFIYLTATVYDNWQRQRYDNWRQRQDTAAELLREDRPSLNEEGQPFIIKEPQHKEIYYISEDYAKRLQQGYWEEFWGEDLTEAEYSAKSQELMAELKAASILIAAEEESDADGSDNR